MTEQNKSFNRKPNRPFPKHSLEEAMIIAKAIQDKNAAKPIKRLLVADAVERKPTSPEFRDLLSSSFKYGLTLGTEKAEFIELTDLGKKLTKPLTPEMGIEAKQTAIMTPDIFKKIYNHYKDNKVPKGTFFENSLEVQFQIPREYVQEIAIMIEKNGKFAGIIRDISGSPHIILNDLSMPISEQKSEEVVEDSTIPKEERIEAQKKCEVDENSKKMLKPIFIAHGKDKKPLEQLRKILD